MDELNKYIPAAICLILFYIAVALAEMVETLHGIRVNFNSYVQWLTKLLEEK